MSNFLRNCLCFIGWHDWEWKTEVTYLPDGYRIETEKARCLNWRCASHRWMIKNPDRRPW